MNNPTVFPVLNLALAPPRDCHCVEEFPEWRPQFVSMRAAARFELLTKAAKPARPFEEEPKFDLLATLVKTACLTHAGEVRWDFLTKQLRSGVES